MHKFLMKDIEQRSPEIDYLEVQSFEMNVYLVQITIGEKTGFIYDDSDRPKRFFSAGHIREAFASCQVTQAVMIHDTPYDEMIGNPPKSKTQTALPFTMKLPY